MKCPACTTVELTEGVCRVCGGAWLDEAAVRERTARDLELHGVRFARRACPVCQAELTTTLVFDVEIERCAEHGMWFDKAELAEVMKRSRNDEWRLYGGVNQAPGRWNPIGGLLDAIRIWRRSRNKPA